MSKAKQTPKPEESVAAVDAPETEMETETVAETPKPVSTEPQAVKQSGVMTEDQHADLHEHAKDALKELHGMVVAHERKREKHPKLSTDDVLFVKDAHERAQKGQRLSHGQIERTTLICNKL